MVITMRFITGSATGARLETLPGENTRPTAERVKAVIERNFTNPELNVDRIAELLGLHRVTLSRAFSACYGHSVIEHLIACRVNHALHLLKDPRRSIEETARASGFSSPEYFARTIRRITGSSPAKLRGK